MTNYGAIVPFIFIALIIFLIVFIYRKVHKGRSVCKKCKTNYTYPENIEIYSGPLYWEKKKKEETKGDFTYEIEYLVYYRNVTFYLTCLKCGDKRDFTKRYELYRSDSTYSQSNYQELELLKDKIRNTFDKSVFANVSNEDIDIEFPQGF